MQLLASAITEMQQTPIPDTRRAVQLARLLNRLLHILLIIHIDNRLEEKAFRQGILLSAHIILEHAVVRTEERQLALEPLLRLLHRLRIVQIHSVNRQFTPNLLNHLLDFLRSDDLIISIDIVRKNFPFISLTIRINCHYMYCLHFTSIFLLIEHFAVNHDIP